MVTEDKDVAALIGIIARQNAEIARLLQENEKLKILLSDAQTCVEKMLDAVVLTNRRRLLVKTANTDTG